MIYFKKCAFSAGNGRVSHRNILRTEAYSILQTALIQKGIPIEKQQLTYNEYGKPLLKYNLGWYFNISHCEGLAICALAKSPIGADIENIRDFPERVMNRCFTESEIHYVRENMFPKRAFFQIWTLKESYVKAIGIGISYPLINAEFNIDNNHITANVNGDFSFMQIVIDNEYICSLCCNSIFNNQVYFRSFENKISFDQLK